MPERLVDEFMTKNPHTIGAEDTLAAAKTAMRQHGVRHLPVVDDATVVGILSEREVDLIAAIAERTADEIGVRRALISNVLEVSADEPVAAVAQRMAASKTGSAVVMDGDAIVGIFTTVDALTALAQLGALV